MVDYGWCPKWQLPQGVQARITTVSEPGNLATHVNDNPILVASHRTQLAQELALPQPPKWLAQYHSTKVIEAQQAKLDEPADAIWSAQPQTVCAVLTADCLPILLCSDCGDVVAAIHAGWRGLAQGIVAETLTQLPLPANQFRAFIGPAIGPKHFEVGGDVYHAFEGLGVVDSQSFKPHIKGKWLTDLPLLAERVLQKLGIQNVTQSAICTFSDERFFSYRQDPTCGRFASLIWKN